MDQNVNSCPVCNALPNRIAPDFRKGFVKCLECQLVLSEKYQDSTNLVYIYEQIDPIEDVSKSRLELYSTFLNSASDRFSGAMTILDVGCSNGTFMEMAAKRGNRVYGVEPAELLAAQAQRKGLDISAGVLSNLPEEWGPFNLITYWDSFMLVDDPVSEMRRILSKLTREGWIYFRLRQHRYQRFLYYCWKKAGGLLRLPNPSVYHPLNFTPKTIQVLADRFNLNVEIEYAKLTTGDPYSTFRFKSLVILMKTVMAWLAKFAWVISRGKWICSTGMNVWFQRKI